MLAIRTATVLMLAGLLTACEDSTGPGALDLRLAASAFNSLERSRMSAGDGDGATTSRVAALALRAGVRPARVRIAVDGLTEDYWALEVEHALAPDITGGPVLTLPIVARMMIAWRAAPAQRVISIRISSDTGTFSLARHDELVGLGPDDPYYELAFGILFERGGPVHLSVDGGARSTRQTIGAECTLPERPPILQLLSPLDIPATCHTARFFTRFSMRVQEPPVGGAAAIRVRVVEMDGQDVPGIRLEYPWLYRPCAVCD